MKAGRTLLGRLTAGVLTLVFSSAVAEDQQTAIRRLIQFAKTRDKQAGGEWNDARKRMVKAQDKGMKAHREGRKDEQEIYWRQKSAYARAFDTLAAERQFLQRLFHVERDGLPKPIATVVFGNMQGHWFERMNKEVDRQEIPARVRWEVAKHKNEDPHRVTLLAEELAAWSHARAALQKYQHAYDEYYNAIGTISVAQFQEQARYREALRRQRAQQLELEKARQRDYVAALIVAAGAAGALAIIMSAKSATGERSQSGDGMAADDPRKLWCELTGGLWTGAACVEYNRGLRK
jgi:hypothetical protein